MGCQRAGFYSLDRLDNGGRRSAREIHPELQALAVGSILPATPRRPDGFEVLRLEPPRLLGLGILLDADRPTPLPFAHPRPRRFRHVSWTFVLEPLDGRSTRLYARVRGAFPPQGRWYAIAIRPVHRVMQTAQLRNLARRVEGRQPLDDWRGVRDGLASARRMVTNAVTASVRPGRSARTRRS
jgi:hypothetical protein